MAEDPYKNWESMNDAALGAHLGAFVRHHRIAKNKTQQQLAAEAGISRSTLSLLERGEPVMLSTLIQVLRVLDQLQVMAAFTVPRKLSPLQLARREKEERRRVRGKNERSDDQAVDW
jgi:transcriptional regulator with XRE-family HTH domain